MAVARTSRWKTGLGTACLVLAASAGWQHGAVAAPMYKCVGKSGVTYSQIPCPGGREVGTAATRATDKHREPPQERAVIARRAGLSAEDKQECRALDVRLKEQQRELKARGSAVTLQDEMPLVHSKKRFRELKC